MKDSDKTAKIIRTVTIAPIMALAALSFVYILKPELYHGTIQYILSIVYLTILPILAYPLQPYIPEFKDKGREGQRNLAIIMAVIGYLCSIASAWIFHTAKAVWVIYLTYFISGIGILVFNKFLKIRASGHACGVTGPLAIVTYFFGLRALIGAIILIPVYWACIKMKRHTMPQLVWGTIIPIIALLLSVTLTGSELIL